MIKTNTVSLTRKLTLIAVLSAISSILMFFSFSVPFMPSFIKVDFSELPALLASFAYGPLSGVCVCLIKNLINAPTTTTAYVGEFANFLLGAAFVFPAGLIYLKNKTRKGALLGALMGALFMALISVPLNYFVTYPIYQNFMPIETIIGMYQAIFGGVNGLLECLIIFNAPFTFLKGIVVALLTFLVYKPLSPLLKGRKK